MTDTTTVTQVSPIVGTIEGLVFRHALGLIGGVLVHAGAVSAADESSFEKVGLGILMWVSALALSWWQKQGQKELQAEFTKLLAIKSRSAAVQAATPEVPHA